MLVLTALILVAVASDPVLVQSETAPNQSDMVQEAKKMNDDLERILYHLRQVEPAPVDPTKGPITDPTPPTDTPIRIRHSGDNVNGFAESDQ